MAELVVDGTLNVNQFWPDGTSDADTTKIIVQANGFRVRDLPDGQFRPTHVFDAARVKGRGGTKSAVDAHGKVTVRLQGIDAPELHFRPPPLQRSDDVSATIRARYNELNDDFRQHFGETATVALGTFLKRAGVGELPCQVVTIVGKPNDVFDTFGRFVGDIQITVDGAEVVINQWLAASGWAYPAFYNSMSADEINTIRGAAAPVKTTSPIWKKYTGTIDALDFDLIFRRGGQPDAQADKGPVILPKLFRRLATWTVAKKAGVPGTATSFRKFLEQGATKDPFFLVDEFIAQGGTAAPLQHFPEHFNDAGKFELKPDEMVFRESPSTLIDASGDPISDWD